MNDKIPLFERKVKQYSKTPFICPFYIGALNDPHAKCKVCGKEEWEHKLKFN